MILPHNFTLAMLLENAWGWLCCVVPLQHFWFAFIIADRRPRLRDRFLTDALFDAQSYVPLHTACPLQTTSLIVLFQQHS